MSVIYPKSRIKKVKSGLNGTSLEVKENKKLFTSLEHAGFVVKGELSLIALYVSLRKSIHFNI